MKAKKTWLLAVIITVLNNIAVYAFEHNFPRGEPWESFPYYELVNKAIVKMVR